MCWPSPCGLSCRESVSRSLENRGVHIWAAHQPLRIKPLRRSRGALPALIRNGVLGRLRRRILLCSKTAFWGAHEGRPYGCAVYHA